MSKTTSWLFTQNSTPPSACPHERILLANDMEPTLCCDRCGKRWSFVPAGETPRYYPDDDPTYPGMLDDRGWSKSTRVTMLEGPDVAIAPDAMCVTVTGAYGADATVLARAVLEMLQEADVRCSMPEEIENPYDGDSIEQLGALHHRKGLHVIVQTGVP